MKKIIASILVSTVVLSGCSLFKVDPQEAVNKGLQKLALAERMSSSFDIKGTITMPPEEEISLITFDLSGTGRSDASDLEDVKIDFNYRVGVNVDGEGGSVAADVRTLDKTLFFRVTDLALPGKDSALITDQLGQLTNTWFNIPLEEGNPFQTLTDEQLAFRERFKETRFFINATEDGEEELRGIETRRYRVELNKEAVKDLIIDIGRTTENVISPEEESAIQTSLDDVDFSGAVWVGKDKLVHRIQGTFTIQPSQGASSSFDIDYSIWDVGEKFIVEKPADVKEFNPLMMLPIVGALSSFGPGGAEEPVEFEEGEPIDAPLGAEQIE